MKGSRVLPVAAILAVAVSFGVSPLRAQTGSMSHGAYTPSQAAAGAKIYAAQCSACHGANLRGVSGPALIGDAFTAQWTDEPASDVYMMMLSNMPLGRGGSLKPAEYLAVLAYILQRNKYPAGTTPLTRAKLKTIKIVSPAS